MQSVFVRNGQLLRFGLLVPIMPNVCKYELHQLKDIPDKVSRKEFFLSCVSSHTQTELRRGKTFSLRMRVYLERETSMFT